MYFIINGIKWNVEYVNPASDYLLRSNGTRTCGMCDGENCTIYLSNRLSDDFMRHVFIHEVCHAAMFSYDLHIPIEYEEFLCSFVADYGDEIFGIVDSFFNVLRNVA